jgi:anti-sigma factor RsiW
MKCSLLTLSTYMDSELEPRKRVEMEAHLVGCERCTRGLHHLREESERVGALARVHVLDTSVQSLMEQVGVPAVDSQMDVLSGSAGYDQSAINSSQEGPQ